MTLVVFPGSVFYFIAVSGSALHLPHTAALISKMIGSVLIVAWEKLGLQVRHLQAALLAACTYSLQTVEYSVEEGKIIIKSRIVLQKQQWHPARNIVAPT